MLLVAKNLQRIKPVNVCEKSCPFVSRTTMCTIVKLDELERRMVMKKLLKRTGFPHETV